MDTVPSRPWDKQTDLLVIGAGAGGLTAALVGKLQGLDTLVCEKTQQVGGITSTSGGTIWVPGSSQSLRDGVPDSAENAAAFLASVVGRRGGDDARRAFLQSGPAMLDQLEQQADIRFIAAQAHPDYLGNHPGAAHGGRALGPAAFDGRRLGADFARVRPPRPEFMGLGGMMVNRTELGPLMNPFGSWPNFRLAASLVLRYAADRLRYTRGTRLVMGNALVGQLFHALRQHRVPVMFGAELVELVREGDAVTGAIIASPQGRIAIRARRGVVLATGGVSWNKALRAQLFPAGAQQMSLAPETNTGDGIAIGVQAGAALNNGHDSPGLWMPCSILRRKDGTQAVWPHIILDRAKPGLIAVNSTGRRFVNESDSYHDFCMGMLRAHESAPSIPAHLIVDASFIRDYGLGLVLPGTKRLRPFIEAGYLIEAPTLQALAARIGVDATALAQTVAQHNVFAETGNDEAFGRGTSDMNRFNGDAANTPNPCMRPILRAPFYAVAVYPADLAGSAGLEGDVDGRVLRPDGLAIPGLYACGNDLASIFRGTYPGPGTTIGPAMVFAWRIAHHAAGTQAMAPAPVSS